MLPPAHPATASGLRRGIRAGEMGIEPAYGRNDLAPSGVIGRQKCGVLASPSSEGNGQDAIRTGHLGSSLAPRITDLQVLISSAYADKLAIVPIIRLHTSPKARRVNGNHVVQGLRCSPANSFSLGPSKSAMMGLS